MLRIHSVLGIWDGGCLQCEVHDSAVVLVGPMHVYCTWYIELYKLYNVRLISVLLHVIPQMDL